MDYVDSECVPEDEGHIGALGRILAKVIEGEKIKLLVLNSRNVYLPSLQIECFGLIIKHGCWR